MTGASVGGRVEPGFEAVRDACAGQLVRQRRGGAACAAVVDGKAVVDL
jgi:hypothetical protein